MEAAAADTAPVSTVDRINFVILLSVALLHTDCPFAETNCVVPVRSLRREKESPDPRYVQSRSCYPR